MGNRQSQRMRAETESTEEASTSSSISSAVTSVGSGQYDVFLSFRGTDTRKEFTNHLYHSLVKAGTVPVYVFKDDKSIPIGKEFGSQIFDTIAQSKCLIPIISENYASSKWCLLELIHIMDCKKNSSHIVLPIFYKVAPSDVRHLKGNFGEAFHKSEKRFDDDDVQKAKQALREVSDLHGWESTKVANGREGELIQLVVKTVLCELQKDFQLDIPRLLVGLDGRFREIMSWIRIPSINARMIGIYGMGGIGKTTLAKCIYNKLLDEFEHASFLPNIRETSRRHDGMEFLQSQLINDILQVETKVSRIDYGINIIKSRFIGKKVLLLLDDIDDKNQLDMLARERNWFMAGSMIIVTTRNKTVLDQSEFKVDYMYKLEGLNKAESLLLFESHAHREDPSLQDYKSISHDIISTLGGLPLALKVIGSYFYKVTDQKVWEDVCRQLKRQPFEEVQKTLRISYDTLTDEHKQIFVDIACFLIGEKSEFAMFVWEGYGFFPSIGIKELKSRCLIDINDDGRFEMHDQLRDLGRSIFCEGQPLENRSKPWDFNYEGVLGLLSQNKMKYSLGARFDDLIRAASSGEKDVSEVRWLRSKIDESALSLSTVNLCMPKLAVLDLVGSRITEDWEGWSSFRASTRLTALELISCWNLRSTPDLSAFTQLKRLSLCGCFKLEHLHPSIGELKSLVSLDLSYCRSLKVLPEEVGELKDLEELELSWSGITQIPTSIRSLGKLKRLYPTACKSLRGIPSSIGDLQNLQHLDVSGSGIEVLPSAIGRLKNLRTFDISETPISHVPKSIRNLSSLQDLNLKFCDELRRLPQLPSSLKSLVVPSQSLRLSQLFNLIHLEELGLYGDNPELPSKFLKIDGFSRLEVFSIVCFSSIETLDLSELIHLKTLIVCKCDNLVEVQGPIDGAKFLETLDIDRCESLETLPDLMECEKLQSLEIRNCKKLTQVQAIEWKIFGCNSLEVIPKLSGEWFLQK